MIEELLQKNYYDCHTDGYSLGWFIVQLKMDAIKSGYTFEQKVFIRTFKQGHYFEGCVLPCDLDIYLYIIEIDGKSFQVDYSEDYLDFIVEPFVE